MVKEETVGKKEKKSGEEKQLFKKKLTKSESMQAYKTYKK